MDRVPRDILMDILSRLPVKCIGRCRCVCKTMDAITSEPLFFTLQFNQFSKHNPSIVVLSSEKEKLYLVDDHDNDNDLPPPIIRPTSLKFPCVLEPLSSNQRHGIIGTCNGLLCYSKFLKRNSFLPSNPIYVFNPLTGEHIHLPNFKVAATYFTVCVSGFGFDNSKQEYKVVLALFHRYENSTRTIKKEVLIHTLGTNNWRRGNCEVPSVLEHSYVNTSTASVNGSLHWIMLSYTNGTDSSNPHRIRRLPIIVSFDLGSEDFDFIPIPTSLISTWTYLHCSIMRFDPLGVLRGCLSIVNASYIGHKNCEIDVWVMKKYKDQESWVKQYIIARNCLEPGGDIFPVCILMNGGILMVRGSEVLVCDNIESGKYKTLELDGSLKKQYEEDCVAIPFMGTLISLKQVLEERRNRKPTLKKRRIQLVEGSKQVVKKKPTKGS